MKKAFTLLELVVVIIILGVLATLGLTQYGRMMERARRAEAKQIIGDMRKLAIAYWLANGTVTGISNADVNIGTAEDQIPSQCRSSHYYRYHAEISGPYLYQQAIRCTSGGKDPQGNQEHYYELLSTLPDLNPEVWYYCETAGGPCYAGEP